MTNKEQQTIDNLHKLLSDIKSENQKFREDITNNLKSVTEKVDKKHLPITLEMNILQTAQLAVDASIKEALSKYDSPLTKLVRTVVDDNSVELKKLISDSFQQVIRTEEFKQSIISAFSHKVAKTIISNNDGLFDKVSNELKQDSAFKAKMTIAVTNVVEECLKERKL